QLHSAIRTLNNLSLVSGCAPIPGKLAFVAVGPLHPCASINEKARSTESKAGNRIKDGSVPLSLLASDGVVEQLHHSFVPTSIIELADVGSIGLSLYVQQQRVIRVAQRIKVIINDLVKCAEDTPLARIGRIQLNFLIGSIPGECAAS